MGWYIWVAGQETGPLPLEAIVDRVRDGALKSTDPIRAEEQALWQSAQAVPELAEIFAEMTSDRASMQSGVSPTQPLSTPQAGRGNIFLRHWRGQMSLPFSYWLVGSLAPIVITVLHLSVINGLDRWELNIHVYGLLLCLMQVFTPAAIIWTFWGIFRAANRYQDRGGSALWAGLARLQMILSGIGGAILLVMVAWPFAKEAAYLTAGIDRVQQYRLNLLPGGKELELSGGLSWGTAHAVEEQLKVSPGIEILHLNSVGGRVREALLINKLVQQHHLTTYTATECDSACTIIFVAGHERYLANGARLGFHSMYIVGTTRSFEAANRLASAAYSAAGLPPDFVAQALATPSTDLWFPRYDQLTQAHVVTEIVDPKRYGLSGLQQWRDASALEQELTKFSAFKKLKQYDSAGYQLVIDRMMVDYRRGTPPLDIQRDVMLLFQTKILPPHMAAAPDDVTDRFAQLVVKQLTYIAQTAPQFCPALIHPDGKTKLDFDSLISLQLRMEGIDILGDLVEGSALHPYTAPAGEDLRTQVRDAYSQFAASTPTARDIWLHADSHRDQPQLFCTVVADFYKSILNGPDQTREAAILRFILSQRR